MFNAQKSHPYNPSMEIPSTAVQSKSSRCNRAVRSPTGILFAAIYLDMYTTSTMHLKRMDYKEHTNRCVRMLNLITLSELNIW